MAGMNHGKALRRLFRVTRSRPIEYDRPYAPTDVRKQGDLCDDSSRAAGTEAAQVSGHDGQGSPAGNKSLRAGNHPS